MAQLQKSVATLRIFGDDLIPEEITRILGAAPTYSQIKGQELVGQKTDNVRIAKNGTWQLSVSDQEPGNLDAQVQEIFAQLTNDIAVWLDIVARYEVDLFCGFFMGSGNDGLTISPASLTALGSRGIQMELDIYSDDEDRRVVL